MLSVFAVVSCSDTAPRQDGVLEMFPPCEIERHFTSSGFHIPTEHLPSATTIGPLELLVFWSPDSGLLSWPDACNGTRRMLTPSYEWRDGREALATRLAVLWNEYRKAEEHSADPATKKEAEFLTGRQGAD